MSETETAQGEIQESEFILPHFGLCHTPPFDMFFGLYSQGTTFSLESPLIIQTVGMKCLTPGFFKAVSQAPGSRKCQINAGDPNRIYPIIGPLNMDLTPGSCPDHGASEAQSLGKSQLGGSCR